MVSAPAYLPQHASHVAGIVAGSANNGELLVRDLRSGTAVIGRAVMAAWVVPPQPHASKPRSRTGGGVPPITVVDRRNRRDASQQSMYGTGTYKKCRTHAPRTNLYGTLSPCYLASFPCAALLDDLTPFHPVHLPGGIVGIAPEATIIPIKVLDNNAGDNSFLIQGLLYAASPLGPGKLA